MKDRCCRIADVGLSPVSSSSFKVTVGVVFSAIGGSIVLIQGLVILLFGEALIFSIPISMDLSLLDSASVQLVFLELLLADACSGRLPHGIIRLQNHWSNRG